MIFLCPGCKIDFKNLKQNTNSLKNELDKQAINMKDQLRVQLNRTKGNPTAHQRRNLLKLTKITENIEAKFGTTKANQYDTEISYWW
nr:unnamed protein product [Callosobruchus analis]